jgi:LuxR family quorum sensing-dependent transcriptional regulator
MQELLAPGLFELIGRITAMHSAAAVWKTYIQAAQLAGMPYGIAVVTGSHRPLADRLLAGTMPTGWLEHYQRENYGAVNPLAQRAAQATRPFAWQTREWNARDNRLLAAWKDDNISAGMPVGIGVPWLGLGESRAIVIGGENTDLHPNDRRTLHFAGLAALQRIQELSVPVTPHLSLSHRERECLTWVSAGKSDWEIGAILSLSEKTVNIYIERAKAKLEVSTRVQAVVQAIRTGQISV